MDYRFRPIPRWPHRPTAPYQRRSRSTFKAGWQNTLDLLDREVRLLDGQHVLIGGGWSEGHLRQDGMLRANAPAPQHPGIELSFDAVIAGRRQRLVYATDVCEFWQHNVRSIALGLEALRAVDRYGVTRSGEQYAGFKELPSGSVAPSADRGRDLIRQHGGVTQALKATHPDHGGDAAKFADVQAAREAR
jgi:hypothetical protein